MKERKRIKKLFEDLYDGSPWIDVTIMGTLKNVTAQQAAKRILPGRNTIWEIVNHLISWRQNVLQRVQGEIMVSPSNNYFSPVDDTSENAWQLTLKRLEQSQKDWLKFLKEFDKDDFEKIYPVNNMTWYEHIQGILQHDAYHLGQVVLLAKSA